MKKKNQMQSINTDLILEQDLELKGNSKVEEKNNIKVVTSTKDSFHYTTIYYQDIMENRNYQAILEIFIKEIKKYLKLKENDTTLVIGLGNPKSTPDSLGPQVIDKVLITRYLFLLNTEADGYSNVCSFQPNVMGNTGIETSDIIKNIIKETKATKVIIIDSLKTNHIERLCKTIQITDQGIAPGSGIQNNRTEMNKKTMGIDVIAIGIPTVVDIETIIENYTQEKISIPDNLIVTPTNIDFLIEKLSFLISDAINTALHKNYIRQNIH